MVRKGATSSKPATPKRKATRTPKPVDAPAPETVEVDIVERSTPFTVPVHVSSKRDGVFRRSR